MIKIPKKIRASVRGVVFDMDDTVTRDGRLQAASLSAMEDLATAGLDLVLVTGRPLGWVDVVARLLPVGLAIGENGAGWVRVHEGKVEEGYFDDEDAREAHSDRLDWLCARVTRELPDVKPSADSRHRRCDRAFDIGEYASLSKSKIDALVNLIKNDGLLASVSTVHCHATASAANKASGAEAAFQAAGWGFDPDQWIFIGDSGNDAAAFEAFPHSVGVANVKTDALPTPPKYVTEASHGEGFAELAKHLLDGRG